MRSLKIKPSRGGRVAEKKIFTEQVVFRPCIYGLAPSVQDDMEALYRFAGMDINLLVTGKVPQAGGHADLTALVASARPLVFYLPGNMTETPMQNPDVRFEPSVEVRLQHLLHAEQRRLVVCCCGVRTGRLPSHVANMVEDAARAGFDTEAGSAAEPVDSSLGALGSMGATPAAALEFPAETAPAARLTEVEMAALAGSLSASAPGGVTVGASASVQPVGASGGASSGVRAG